MQLLLVRHGNTFTEGTGSVWIGRDTDLPLTERGIAQAETLGKRLADFKIPVAAIYSGPLKRHRQHAAIIARCLGRSEDTVIVDQRLNEIDYGVWEGKSDAEIRESGYGDALDAWTNDAVFPGSGVWGEDNESIEKRVDSFLASSEHASGENVTLLAVTSGGLLRYMRKVAGISRNALGQKSCKVAPGNVCSIYLGGMSWQTLYWNALPEEMPL